MDHITIIHPFCDDTFLRTTHLHHVFHQLHQLEEWKFFVEGRLVILPEDWDPLSAILLSIQWKALESSNPVLPN